MTSTLKARIIERMAAKNLSIAELERRAGLTIHSVRNILKDRIKKPNVHSLQAIADALDCSLLDLINSSPTPEPEFHQKKIRVSPPVKDPELMLECTKTVLNLIRDHNLKICVDDYVDIVRKVYIYSSKGDSPQVDVRFAEWLIETQIGYSRAS